MRRRVSRTRCERARVYMGSGRNQNSRHASEIAQGRRVAGPSVKVSSHRISARSLPDRSCPVGCIGTVRMMIWTRTGSSDEWGSSRTTRWATSARVYRSRRAMRYSNRSVRSGWSVGTRSKNTGFVIAQQHALGRGSAHQGGVAVGRGGLASRGATATSITCGLPAFTRTLEVDGQPAPNHRQTRCSDRESPS